LILAVVVDGEGRQGSEIWSGNTDAVGSLVAVIERFRRRLAIGQVCVVADRGMISAETIAGLKARDLLYLLGVRERSDKRVRELVLGGQAPFVPLVIDKRGKQTDDGAKAVELAGAHTIVCRNQQQAEKDAADRKAIVAALERQLARGDKALVANRGHRRFLKTLGKDRFAIDPAKVQADARFDGIFVLRTNTDLDRLTAMLRYKQLWTVDIDQAWRLSRFFGGIDFRWQATPRRLCGANGFQGGDGVGVGMDELVITAAVGNQAAA
jgi:hypothetical protein